MAACDMLTRRTLVALGLMVVATAAFATSPPKPTSPTSTSTTTFQVFVKVQGPQDKGPRLVHAADVTRGGAGAAPVVTGKAVAELDGLGVAFQAAWLEHIKKAPATVTFTEIMHSDTGMKPTPIPVKVSFQKGDALYWPAVLRAFVDAKGYDGGLARLRWVDFDRSAGSPAGADDRRSKHSNFRPGTSAPYDAEGAAFFAIKTPIRPSGMGSPQGVLRPSKSKPGLAVSQDFDNGTFTIAYVRLFRDGHSEVTPRTVGEDVAAAFSPYGADVAVSVIDNGEYQKRAVKAGTALHLEAHLVEELEHRAFYVVEPAIDPAPF